MSKAEELAKKLPDAIGSVDMLTCIEAARHLRALDASHQRLLEALEQAKDDLEEWGGYVSDYFKDKHGFEDDLEAIDAAIKQAKELS